MSKNFVSETVLKLIVKNIMRKVTKHSNNSITIASLKKRITDLELRVNTGEEEEFTRTTKMNSFNRDLFIPLISVQEDLGCTIDISFGVKSGGEVEDPINFSMGFVIPPRYVEEPTTIPVCSYISSTLHTLNLFAFITLDEIVPFEDGPALKYIRISLEATDGEPTSVLDICNYQDVTIFSQEQNSSIEFNPDIHSMERLKYHGLYVGTYTGVEDIPNKDQLVRSTSIDYVEIKSKDEFELLETENTADSRTLYNVVEGGE